MKNFDVVIVGGGPSGLSCAIELQKKGVSNCVIEKACYPREKLCGGLLTEKAFQTLSDLTDGNITYFDDAFLNESNTVSIWDGREIKCRVAVNHKLRFVDRATFDSRLKDYYLSLGGTVFAGEKAVDLDLDTQKLYTDRDVYQYRLLVAADGVNSIIRKKTGLTLDEKGFCMESYVPKNAIRSYRYLLVDEDIQIRFGVIPNGYAWVFPCGDHYKIGFGNCYDPSFDYKFAFNCFLYAMGVYSKDMTKISGAFVPYGDCLSNPVVNNSVIFVGDAAGTVDPIYGEGLYFALHAGKQLSMAVGFEGTDFRFDVNQYYAEHEQTLRFIEQGRKLRNKFFKPRVRKKFLQKIPDHPTLVSFYIDNQVSLYRYPHGQPWKLLCDYIKQKHRDSLSM